MCHCPSGFTDSPNSLELGAVEFALRDQWEMVNDRIGLAWPSLEAETFTTLCRETKSSNFPPFPGWLVPSLHQGPTTGSSPTRHCGIRILFSFFPVWFIVQLILPACAEARRLWDVGRKFPHIFHFFLSETVCWQSNGHFSWQPDEKPRLRQRREQHLCGQCYSLALKKKKSVQIGVIFFFFWKLKENAKF